MSDIVINIGEIHIVIQQSPVQLTSEKKQQAYAESVEAEKQAKEAQEEIRHLLESVDVVHSTGYPDDVITPAATHAQKKAFLDEKLQAAFARCAARREAVQTRHNQTIDNGGN